MKKQTQLVYTAPDIDTDKIHIFRELIWNFYHAHRRDFIWRNPPHNPYHILISEVMLQQTQTQRVIEKFDLFIRIFPAIQDLARASLAEVLFVWQGLGYNRRGKFLHQAAQKIMADHQGDIPNCPTYLETLPGIGAATAASICAFAFNRPVVFIETNIRAVVLHHFFPGVPHIADQQVRFFVEAALDHDNPREWYYALMDYGAHLKKVFPNPSRRSKHHTTQSKFEGSNRQIRGAVIRLLTQAGVVSGDDLLYALRRFSAQRVEQVLADLSAEHMISIQGQLIKIQQS